MSTQTMITITEKAAQKVHEFLEAENDPELQALRVAVQGGGCSGFQYHFDFTADAPAADDLVFGTEHAPVLVDETSLQFIKGSQLDYVATLGTAAFEIRCALINGIVN